jgi:hypothetical protein
MEIGKLDFAHPTFAGRGIFSINYIPRAKTDSGCAETQRKLDYPE